MWTSEIKLRASDRIGDLVRELETAQGARTDLQENELIASSRKKSEAIADAGPPMTGGLS